MDATARKLRSPAPASAEFAPGSLTGDVGARNLRLVRFLGRVASIASLGGVALLVAFHGWLFTLRLVEGRFAEPGVALRWAAAVLLLAGLAALRRAGVPLLWGRKALVFWVLVVLLHWTAAPVAEPGLEVDGLLIALPATLASAIVLGGLLLAPGNGLALPLPTRAPGLRLWIAGPPELRDAFLPLLAARPPPA